VPPGLRVSRCRQVIVEIGIKSAGNMAPLPRPAARIGLKQIEATINDNDIGMVEFCREFVDLQ